MNSKGWKSRWTRLAAAVVVMAVAAASAAGDQDGALIARRAAMVRVIQAHSALVGALGPAAEISRPVLLAMGRVPRHHFVSSGLEGMAYGDRPLPIGHGQTISQPYIVALMTELLGVGPGAVVLEIGTGSGYQAAVLAELGAKVYTIEIVPPLAAAAAARLARLGYGTAEARLGDGYYGWPGPAPFDGIVVTAAASHVPPSLVEQLRPGGRMVIPVGGPFSVQQLVLITKNADGTVRTEQLLPVRFVPLTGGH